jgi:hypothetical protein
VEEAIHRYRLPRPHWLIADVGTSLYRRDRGDYGLRAGRTLLDLIDGHALPVQDGHVAVPALGFHWLRQP